MKHHELFFNLPRICSVVPVSVHGLVTLPVGCGTTATLQPVSACILVIWSPPLPIINPTMLSGTGYSSVVNSCPFTTYEGLKRDNPKE